ncbi:MULTISPECIES: helix-turn-helix domain-containing protein [unclassified Mycobacterium]|uniref:TetR/AcrR family transcriptional regulator n=1 Tax=unclassified Mycobacterium TaxID=2642494 RepID=UPI0029C66442|nr:MULTISPECIES: helix-turn-helix domain-containing protein [unclassified Mycobacterium]
MPDATSATVGDAKRQAVVDHVLPAARRVVMQIGLETTMDQIAEAAGVSRRTLFRLFDSREKLIAAAFAAGMAGYSEQLPAYDGDLEGWLRATCQAAHRMNSVVGPGYFQVTSSTELPPGLAAVEKRRLRERRVIVADVARILWRAAGGKGDPPARLATTVSAHLSSYFTAAVKIDVGDRWQAAGDLAYDAIMAALERERPGATR